MRPQLLAQKERAILPILRCPLCGQAFSLHAEHSLVCAQNHCFDLSRQGYINLMPSPHQQAGKYSAPLFESRRAILDAGFYEPALQAIADFIEAQTPEHEPFTLLDAGCGEGYYARELSCRFPSAHVLGVDISRDAVIAAAKTNQQVHWLVGNIARLPVADHCVSFLLDVLTPADYSEFARVLNPQGFFIKVIPGDDYLMQVRKCAAPYLRNAEYSNRRVVEHLAKHAVILQQRTIRQTCAVTPAQAACFMRMTPMTFGLAEDAFHDASFAEITIHLDVLFCRMLDKHS